MTTIAIVLTTLWLVSMANGYTMGGYIHLLPIIVIIGGISALFQRLIRKAKKP